MKRLAVKNETNTEIQSPFSLYVYSLLEQVTVICAEIIYFISTMKYPNGIFLSLLLISMIGAVKRYNFSKEAKDFAVANKKQYSILQKVIDLLDIKTESESLKVQQAKVNLALAGMGRIYKKLGRSLGDMCFYNDTDHNRSLLHPNLYKKSSKFEEKSNRAISLQVSYLKAAVHHVSSNTALVQEHLDLLRKELTNLSDALAYVRESLLLLRAGMLETLNSETSKKQYGHVEAMTETFVQNSQLYVLWFDNKLLKLKYSARAIWKFVGEFQKHAKMGQNLVVVVEDLISDHKLEKLREEQIIELSDAMGSVVKTFTLACLDDIIHSM